MLDEMMELLDLTVIEKGVGSALYASTESDGCNGGSCSCTWSLCCTCLP
jgi:hypothetical protein